MASSLAAVSSRSLVLAAVAAALLPVAALSQQQPIYGCRQSINCRPSPVGASALNDRGASGLLVGASIRWGPGFHFGLVTPLLKIPLIGEEPAVDLKTFRLPNVTLLPPAEPTPAASPAPAPPPTVTPRAQ
ncbi:MAG: hypothetical protein M3167_19120 [Acidobacteriota bacterium]|nr:hypothetical protein [Acidobacteriota bacterium]